MIVYEGKFIWNGKKTSQNKPVSWYPGSCIVKVIDLAASNPGIFYINPSLVILTATGEGVTIKNSFPNFAKNISLKFDLKLEKTLWMEYVQNPFEHMEVATIKPVTTIASDLLFSTSWRPIMSGELALIKPYISGEWYSNIRNQKSTS